MSFIKNYKSVMYFIMLSVLVSWLMSFIG